MIDYVLFEFWFVEIDAIDSDGCNKNKKGVKSKSFEIKMIPVSTFSSRSINSNLLVKIRCAVKTKTYNCFAN